MPIDINALINTNTSAVLDTQYPIPVEKEYIASIGTPREKIEEWFREVHRDDGSTSVTINIPFILQDEEQRERLGVRQLSSRLTIWVDLELSGALSTGHGKNVSLGQLKEALGQKFDKDWNFNKLIGAGPVRVITSNTTGKDGRHYSNVTKVSKL